MIGNNSSHCAPKKIMKTLKKSFKIRKIFVFLAMLTFSCFAYGGADARLIFQNEEDGTYTDVFYLDKDNSSTNFIDLEFGQGIDSKIRFDILNDEFELNRDLDVGGNQIKNLAIENLATAPTCDASAAGRVYYNTTDNFSYVCNGTDWNALDEDVAATINAMDTNIVVLDDDDTGGDVTLQFGATLNEYLRWDNVNQWFVLSDDLYIEGNTFIDFRVENRDGSVSIPACDNAGDLGKQYYDTNDGNAYVCIEPNPSGAPGVYEWFDLTTTFTTTATKVVTVGTGGNYASIEAAAGYLNSLTGGIILLTAETHNVTNVVDLENITLIGANTGDTTIALTGNGFMQVKETQFKSLTIDIDAAIIEDSGIEAKYDASTTSSVIFEWVDFQIGGTKYLIDSTEVTAPTVRTRFISTSATVGNRQILMPQATANLNIGSTHFIESQSGSGGLNFADWDVTISGSGNVVTSGNITTIPENTVYVYPGMNIQSAIDSLPGGGFVTLLPGIHSITSTLLIDNDGIEITGYGDSTVIQATGFASTADTVGAIQIGAADGTAPNNDVVLRNFKLEVGNVNIHGIRATGGSDIQLYNLTVVKTAGVSGSGTTARIGIQFLDGTGEQLIRPVIKNCRVFGDAVAGSYFTDGIHISGGTDYGFNGIWSNASGTHGVRNALIEGNNVDYVRETVAVFLGVEDSSLFNNRFSRMGAGGGSSFGLFMGNTRRANMNANVIATSLSTGSSGFVIEVLGTSGLKTVEDSLFSSNTVDGTADGGVGFLNAFYISGTTANTAVNRNIFQGNIVRGASVGTNRRAFYIQNNADENIFSNNVIVGGTNEWDIGFDINDASSDRNMIRGTQYDNVTTHVQDSGTATVNGVAQHRATADPTGNDDVGDGYEIGTIWINTNVNTAYILIDNTAGAADWNQIDGAGGGGGVTAVSSTADPTVNDDVNAGYGVGTLWVNTNTDQSFILVDNTAGAAVWNQIDGGSGGGVTTSTSDPTIADDGFSLGTNWINTTTNDTFIITDNTPGNANWEQINGSGAGGTTVTAAADPTINDDSDDGYAIGTHWVNTTTDNTFLLTDNTVGAANWEQTNGAGGGGTTITDTVDPTVNDDSGDGYDNGTLWINTTDEDVFILTDNTLGAANWEHLNGSAPTGGSVADSLAAVQARRTTNFTLTNATTWYDIPLDTTDVETDATVIEHDNVNTEQIDIKSDGLYRITYQIRANDPGATHTVETRVQANGTTVLNGSTLGETNYQGEYGSISGNFLADLTSGDYVTLQAQRTTNNEVVGETLFSVTKLEAINGSVTDVTVTSTSDPTVNDDSGDGYLVGVHWINTSTNDSFILTDNTAGFANWEQVNSSGGLLAVSSTSDPTVNDDINAGYTIGTQWVNTTTEDTFVLTDNTVGAANWEQTNNADVRSTMPAVQARRTVNFAISTTWTDVTFDATDVETDNTVIEHNNTTTDRIDIKENGLYQIAYDVDTLEAADAIDEAWVRLNDSSVLSGSYARGKIENQGGTTTAQHISKTFIAELTSSDFVTLQLQTSTGHNAGANATFTVIKLEGIKGDQGPAGVAGNGIDANTFILDQDDTGGDVSLQFGTALAESLTWDSANSEFDLSDNLDINLSGNVFELGDGTASDVFLNFDDGTDRNFGWDDSLNAFSTFDQQLSMRSVQGASIPIACSAGVAGMIWMDTDTGILYVCDTSNGRNKWMSVNELVLFGDESGTCGAGNDPNGDANCNVDWGNGLGPDGGSDLGLYIPHDITITGYGFSTDNDDCTSGSFDVEVWSTGANNDDDNYTLEQEIDTGLTGQAHNANNLNVDIAGDQYILWGIDNNCGQGITDWNVILYFKYRHD